MSARWKSFNVVISSTQLRQLLVSVIQKKAVSTFRRVLQYYNLNHIFCLICKEVSATENVRYERSHCSH